MRRLFTAYSLFYTGLLALLMVRGGHSTISGLIHDPRHRSGLLAGIAILILLFCSLVSGLNGKSLILSMATLTIYIFDENSGLHYVGVLMYGIMTAYSVIARWGVGVVAWIVVLPVVAMFHVGWAEVLYLLWLSVLLEG